MQGVQSDNIDVYMVFIKCMHAQPTDTYQFCMADLVLPNRLECSDPEEKRRSAAG